MKKIVFSLTLLFSLLNIHSQIGTIGILGTALQGYTVPDTDMIQISTYEYVLENQLFSTGTVKFRQDNDWEINWGNISFPSGTGFQNGAEIPISAGTYNVRFNKSNGEYSFFAHANIGIIGTAVSSSGFNGDDVDLTTIDGVIFSGYFPFLNGEMKFRQDNSWTTNWGSTTFPSGTAIQNGANIPIAAGNYLVSFNSNTHEYNFSGTATYPTISLIGTAASGWTTDIDMATTDGITYTLSNYTLTNGEVKFRQNHGWTPSWGGTNFPNGTAILNSSDNIPVTAGIYTVTFNSSNGTYTFIGNLFPSIGIWGPAVDSQNGYVGQDVDMTTTDGIIYTLSGFYFSSGNAYFRQDNTTTNVWGSTAYPTGTAILSGPSLFIPGGEHFVTFNRITGEYSFTFPSIGVIGTAVVNGNGFNGPDTDLTTSDGFTYTIEPIFLTVGELKFRKDDSWTSNWGSTSYPSGTGTQDGPNIPINVDSTYSISFDKSTGNYVFNDIWLGTNSFSGNNLFSVYPNPTVNNWNVVSKEVITKIEITDVLGKSVLVKNNRSNQAIVYANDFRTGIYFAKITTTKGTQIIKLVRK